MKNDKTHPNGSTQRVKVTQGDHEGRIGKVVHVEVDWGMSEAETYRILTLEFPDWTTAKVPEMCVEFLKETKRPKK